MSIFELYLINVALELRTLVEVVFVLSSIISILFILAYIVCSYERDDAAITIIHRAARAAVLTAIICAILVVATPSREAAIWIFGEHIVTNADGKDELPDHTIKAVNSFLGSVSEESGK